MIENIWSGWRSEYITSLAAETRGTTGSPGLGSSVFRRILESEMTDEEAFIVRRGSTVFSIMNAYPYAVGHLLVVPYRQVSELEDLTAEESSEMWSEVAVAVRVMRFVLAPDGFNVGLNLGPAAGGSVNEHIHVHVVPRWFGDANFLVTSATVKSISEALDVTADRLRRAWTLSENKMVGRDHK